MAVKHHRDELAVVDDLAARARSENVPQIDVSHAVLRRLRAYERPADRGLALLTASALAVAAIVAFMSFSDFASALDPLALMMETTASSLI